MSFKFNIYDRYSVDWIEPRFIPPITKLELPDLLLGLPAYMRGGDSMRSRRWRRRIIGRWKHSKLIVRTPL